MLKDPGYKITTDFFAQVRPNISVPCIRAEYPDGTFIPLSHNAPIALPLPFFMVQTNDGVERYGSRGRLLIDNGYHPVDKRYVSVDGKWYEIWEHFVLTEMRQLPGHRKAIYVSSTISVKLFVDDQPVLTIFYNGDVLLNRLLTPHAMKCLRTFCKLYGNDMTYKLLISLYAKDKYIFNILDILCEGGK